MISRVSKLLLLAALALIMVACSSLKQPLQPQAKFNADNALKLAQDYEQQKRFANAIDTYVFALELYRSFANTEGQMYCLSGLARIKLEQSDHDAADEYRYEMQEIAEQIDPDNAVILLLYDLHKLQLDRNYQEISIVAVASEKYTDSQKMQVLSYKIQADAYLENTDQSKVRQLERLAAKHFRKPLRKRQINPQILSQAAYSLAYHYYVAGNMDKADYYLRRSVNLDYSYGNFASLGYSLWLQAKTQMARGKNVEALSLLLKARQVFQSYANLEMISKVEADLDKIAVTGE